MEESILTTLRMEHGLIFETLRMASMSDDKDLRYELYILARNEIVKHMQGEEHSIYQRMEKEIQGDNTPHLIHKLEHHHEQIREYLQKLNLIDHRTSQWKDHFEKLVDLVHYHCGMEEKDLFAEAKEDYSREELIEMKDDYERALHFNPNSYAIFF